MEFRVVGIKNIQNRQYWSKIKALTNSTGFFWDTLFKDTRSALDKREIKNF